MGTEPVFWLVATGQRTVTDIFLEEALNIYRAQLRVFSHVGIYLDRVLTNLPEYLDAGYYIEAQDVLQEAYSTVLMYRRSPGRFGLTVAEIRILPEILATFFRLDACVYQQMGKYRKSLASLKRAIRLCNEKEELSRINHHVRSLRGALEGYEREHPIFCIKWVIIDLLR